MNRNPDSESASQVHVLGPVEFDLSANRPRPAAPGKTTAPVTVLPEAGFDLAVPVLQLTLFLRPEVDPAALTFDVLRFFQALSQYERDLGGTGLSWDEGQSRATPDLFRLVVAANEPSGARERLTRLAEAVTGTTVPAPSVLVEGGDRGRSFVKWEALVLGPAA